MLAVITTAIGHTLFLYSLKKFSVTATSIMASIQPVYGVVLAVIFLREYPTANTLVGGGIILSAVIIESVRTRKA